MELNETDRELLVFLKKGGLIALRIYGKTTKTMEVGSHPSFYAGMMQLARLEEAGLLRQGDPSPYKVGKSFPYVLTDTGKATV